MSGEQHPLGGMAGGGSVFRSGGEVCRSAGPNSAAVHALLAHLRRTGFDGAPEPLGVDAEGHERLSFVAGEVPHPPYPAWLRTDEALASAASLVRRFHDATVGFSPPPGATWNRELADWGTGDVICHSDLRPENVVFSDGKAIAVFDFEFAAPGRREFDLAHFALCFLPFEAPRFAARLGLGGLDPFRRMRLILDAYGPGPDGQTVVQIIDQKIAAGAAFVKRRVAAGDPVFTRLWSQKEYRARYRWRRSWFVWNRRRFLDAVS